MNAERRAFHGTVPARKHLPPPHVDLDAGCCDEMVGLPQQLPGFPGQQRSIDTS